MFLKKYKKKLSGQDEATLEEEVGPAVTVIAPDTVFKGNITGQDTLRISGRVVGDIDCKRTVWVDERGCVNGTIVASLVINEGEINGDIQSAEKVEIRSNGRMIGNIHAVKIIVAPGCFFDGEAQIIRE